MVRYEILRFVFKPENCKFRRNERGCINACDMRTNAGRQFKKFREEIIAQNKERVDHGWIENVFEYSAQFSIQIKK